MTTRYTLREILEAQEKHDEPLPSMDDIKKNILTLITHHQNPDKILLEVLTDHADVGSGQDENIHDNVKDVIDQLHHDAKVSGVPFSSHSATWCASHLVKLLHQLHGSPLMGSSLKKKVMVIVDCARKCMDIHGLNRNLFVNALNNKMVISVEIAWTLHKEDIMSLDLFLSNNSARPDVMANFSRGLLNLSLKGEESSLCYRQQILKDCYGYLAAQAYGECGRAATEKDVRKVCISLLDNITKEFLENFELASDVCIYEGALEMHGADIKNLQKFASHHLTLILGHDPNIQVSQALSDHSEWGFTKTRESLQQALRQLMLVFQENEVIQIFQQFLEEQEVNWKTVLAFVSTFLICFKGAALVLQELITNYLREGLDSCDIEGVVSAFLLARHACFEGPHVFMTYSQWFQMTFTESSQNPAGSKKTFSFLIKFLSDIMPFEKAEFLKVHLTKPPFVPEKCRPLMSDYVTLAKTRLMDLKDPFENVGIYEESGEGDSDLNQLESDVERAVSGFSKTGKVPLTVMEASMFRKPYYMGRFLPALLKPRPLPDVADDKMNLIKSLWQANKIPVNLYNNYTKGCKQESSELLEGVFSQGDESMDDMILEPMDQLAHSLNKLKENLTGGRSEEHTDTTTGDLSLVAEKIQLVLSTANVLKDPGKLQVTDLDVPVVEPVNLQIVDLVVNIVCELINARESSAWVTQLYLTLTQHGSLIDALTVRLWDLLITQGLEMDTSHIDGLSAVLIHLLTFMENGQSLNVIHQQSKDTLEGHFVSSLKVKTKEEMLYTQRFLMSYLSQAFMRFKQINLPCKKTNPVVPLQFVRMFTFLACRIYVPIRMNIPPDGAKFDTPSGVEMCEEASALLSSENYKEISAMLPKWSLKDWIKLESSIDPRYDILNPSERYSYHHWFLIKYYSQDQEELDLRDLARKLFLSVLALELRDITVRPGKPDLMKILSEFVSPAVVGRRPALEGLCWSHECLRTWLKDVDDPIEKQSRICLFVSDMFQFSPQLLFTDDIRKVNEKSIVHATAMVNDILDHWSAGITFDLRTLSYILQGLVMLCHQGYESYVEKILKDCPCITVALVMHWTDISLMFSKETSSVSSTFQNIRIALDSSRSGFSDSFVGTWIEGVALFKAGMTQNTDLDVSRIVTELVSGGHQEVLEVWMTMNLCHLSYLNLCGNMKTSYVELVSKDILRSCPVSLMTFKGIIGAHVLNKALPGSLIRALPLSTAKLFLGIEREGKWADTLRRRPHLLSDLLITHVSCMQLYHEEVTAEQQFPKNEPNDVEELTFLVKMISESLNISPISFIREISKDVFRVCDYSIQVMLRKKVPGCFN